MHWDGSENARGDFTHSSQLMPTPSEESQTWRYAQASTSLRFSTQ